jgi:hypothetical protein
LKDRVLISRVQDRFEVFITADQGFEYEHNLAELRCGLIIVHVRKNKLEHYRPIAGQLREAIDRVAPGQVLHVRAEPSEA